MASPARKVLIGVVALGAVIVVLALILVPRLIDPERYRGRIERMATEAIGRPAGFDSLQVSWWPLGLRVDGVRVGALEGEPAGDALRAGSLRIGARLGPLLRGNLEVTSITVERPVVRVVQTADGEWLLPLPRRDDPPVGDLPAGPPASGPSISIDALELTDGTVELVDAEGRILNTIDDVRARIEGLGGVEPTTIDLRARAAIDAVLSFDAAITCEILDAPGPEADGVWLDSRVELSGPSDTDRLVGHIRALSADGGRLELEIEPSTLSGSTLARLLPALVDPPPVTIIDAGTTELSGRVSLSLADGASPVVDVRASVREMRLDAGLGQPLESVAATIALDAQRVRLSEFSGRLGTNDVRGSITIEPSDPPRLEVDLRSERLDLDELLTALSEPAPGPSGGSTGDGEPSALPLVTGRLRIGDGTLDTLRFTETDTEIHVAGDRVRLEPLAMRLYDGSFNGALAVDLGDELPEISIRGRTEGIDLGSLTAEVFEVPNLLTGRLDAEIDSTMTGLDVEQLLASAIGTATIRVGEGVVGTLDLFERLSGVSGVFGERSLAALSDKIGHEGTAFRTALGRIELDNGTMQLRDLELGSTAFDLGGSARVEMIAGTIDGRFVLRLSPKISATMKADGSKAAELFWNKQTGRVAIPFTLAGPFSRPIPGIDLGEAAKTAIRDRAKDELRDLVNERLGGKDAGDVKDLGVLRELERLKELESPRSEPPAATPAEIAPIDPTRLGARIDSHRWRGSILARDLQLDGVVHGPSLASASVLVRDASGRSIIRREIPEVTRHRETATELAAPATVPFSAKIDGEKLLLAQFPLQIVVTVIDVEDASAEISVAIDR